MADFSAFDNRPPLWAVQHELETSEQQQDGQVGYSVAADGLYAVLGAPGYDGDTGQVRAPCRSSLALLVLFSPARTQKQRSIALFPAAWDGALTAR